MLHHARHARVEDVAQAMLPHVLLRHHPESLCELVRPRRQPHRSQVRDATHMLIEVFKAGFKFNRVKTKMSENLLSIFLVLSDEIEDALTENFGDVFALACFWFTTVKRFVLIRLVLLLRFKLFPLLELCSIFFGSGFF